MSVTRLNLAPFVLFVGLGLEIACSPAAGEPPQTSDSSGGETAPNTGGGMTTGGVVGTGGVGVGGGGMPTGGVVETGGLVGTGAMTGSGATAGAGGTLPTGGSPTGGVITSTGGVAGSAGIGGATGGSDNVGGIAAAGGTPTGGETGTGGEEQQVCTWAEGPSATNGGLTCYWFAQGTAIDEQTCPGGYKTYCGYCGSETGERPQGGDQVWCPIYDVVSTVQNISTTHFAALPPGPLGDNGQNCGMCIEITYQGRSVVATVVDSCPSCLTDEHVDLSLSAAEALGMTEQIGQVESGVTWRVVGCPVTGDIQVNFNGSQTRQVYFQNPAFPIASASSDGTPASLIVGFWDFGKEMAGQEVTLTDVMGHTVTATVPSAPGSLGVQFELSCQ